MNNKGKKKYWACKYFEREYDDFGTYRWCHSDESKEGECMCDTIFQMNVCPLFKKTGNGFFLKESSCDKKETEDFINRLEKEKRNREIKERALLEYLKKKYEH